MKEQVRGIPNKGIDYGILRYLSKNMEPLLKLQQNPSISFNYLGQFDQLINSDSIFIGNPQFSKFNYDKDSKRSHLIDIVSLVVGGELHFHWSYSNKQFDASTIQNVAEIMLEQLVSLINSSVTETAYTASDFPNANLTETSLGKVLSKLTKKRGRK